MENHGSTVHVIKTVQNMAHTRPLEAIPGPRNFFLAHAAPRLEEMPKGQGDSDLIRARNHGAAADFRPVFSPF